MNILALGLAIIAVTCFIRLLQARSANTQLTTALANRESEKARLDERMRALAAELAELAPYQAIRDLHQAAERLKCEAVEAQSEAARLRQASETEASEMIAVAEKEGRRIVQEAQAKGEAHVQEAERRAAQLSEEARTEAERVAGDALRALEQADDLAATVRALKHTIDGYGNAYLQPPYGLIDALADGVSQTEVGEELKAVRRDIRDRLKQGTAATCDYVEDNRRTTAIAFVTDAFNGKVDSILARVRAANHGTLAERIRDAFALVNRLGAAFRDARITEPFLALRLRELELAATAQALLDREREEQRRIKEQLREEAKARREYERAQREAAREEELVRRALAKAEAKLATATAEQRAEYEAQLAELHQRLEAAEQKNQRALFMAQQTRRGHVYIIANVGSLGEDVYKIGLTRRLAPLDRIRELGDSSVPFDFDVHALIWSEDAPTLEHQLHRHFLLNQVNKINHRKEFFRAELSHIRAEVEQLGLRANWTMAAEARQWRETQQIEQRISEDPAAREAWIAGQLILDARDEALLDEEEEDVAQSWGSERR